MTDPGAQQRPQDRGHYGAGWTQPAPGSAPYGAQQAPAAPPYGAPGAQPSAGLPYAPPRPPRTSADPRRAFAPGASVTNTAGALIAVVSLVLVEFVSGVIGMLGTSLVVSPFSSYGSGDSLVASFVNGVFAAPFPYYAGAFLALAFLTPIARRSPLPVVLLRAVLAGAAGTVGLALVGVFTGAFGATRSGVSRLVIDVVTVPLQNGVPFTVMLLATSTAAWLWLGRPRGAAARSAGPGTPGTVRPADAVPPATIPSVSQYAPYQPPQRSSQEAAGSYGAPQAPQVQSGHGVQPGVGQQAPDTWAPPAPR